MRWVSGERLGMRGLRVLVLPSVLLVSALLLMDTNRAALEEPQQMELRPLEVLAKPLPKAAATPWTFEHESKARVTLDGVSLDHTRSDAYTAFRKHMTRSSGHGKARRFAVTADDRIADFDGCCLRVDGQTFRPGDRTTDAANAIGKPVRVRPVNLYCDYGSDLDWWFRVTDGYVVIRSSSDQEFLPEELRGRITDFKLTRRLPR